jgi:hypothetical protein
MGLGVRLVKGSDEIELHKVRKKSQSLWKPPTANTEVRPIKIQLAIAVK